MRRRGTWWALLVLLVSSAAEVPDPENVTVSCQNAAVTVSWDYPEHQPRTLFRVWASLEGRDIIGVETTEHRYDLTHLVWDRQEYYLEYLTVQVAALQGGNESDNKHSNSFSFNSLKVVDTSCSLELPPVEIAVAGETATVSFPNPIQHYRELRRTIAGHSEPLLMFTVSLIGNGSNLGDNRYSCPARDILCKVDVSLPEDAELCVKLKGILFYSEGKRQVTFRETNQTCVSNSDGSHEETLAIVLTTVTISLCIMVAIFICKAKAWTMKTSKLTNALDFPPGRHSNQVLSYDIVPNEKISQVSIVQRSKSLSDTSDDESVGPADRRGLNRSDSTEAFYTQRPLSESSSQTDSDSAHCSVKTDRVSISSEGEPESRSDYDCPHVHLEDMGGGDFITAYEKK